MCAWRASRGVFKDLYRCNLLICVAKIALFSTFTKLFYVFLMLTLNNLLNDTTL